MGGVEALGSGSTQQRTGRKSLKSQNKQTMTTSQTIFDSVAPAHLADTAVSPAADGRKLWVGLAI
jgi:hypothetical protein